MTLQWGGLVRLRDKLNTLYFHLQKTHGHQTRLGADLPWEPPPLKQHDPLTTWPTWGHVKIWNIYIYTLARPMATKLGRVLGYGRRFSTQMLKSPPTSCYFSKDIWKLEDNNFLQPLTLRRSSIYVNVLRFILKTLLRG